MNISACGGECRSAAPALAEIYQTGTPQEREAVVGALTGIVNAIETHYVTEAQLSKTKPSRRVAQDPECRLIAPLLVPAVSKAPADAVSDSGWMAASELLGRCGTAKEVPVFVALLAAADTMVRMSAAEGLQRIGPAAQAAIPALQALSDKTSPGGIRDKYQRALDQVR